MMSLRQFWKAGYSLLGISIVGAVLVICYLYNTLLFHTLSELIGVSISFGIFAVVWNTREHIPHHSTNIVGIGMIFVGAMSLLHVLTYPGINTIQVANANLTTQFGASARFFFALCVLLAVIFHERKVEDSVVLAGWLTLSVTVIVLVMAGKFPVYYVTGQGLTSFAIISDYTMSMMLIVALGVVVARRDTFERGTPVLLGLSIVLFALSGLVSSTYDNLQDWRFVLQNVLKLSSIYLLYRAIAIKRLLAPYQRMRAEIDHRLLAEHNLKESEERFRSIFENAGSMIFIIDRDLSIVDCNPVSFEKTGYCRQEIVGRPFMSLAQAGPAEMQSLMEAIGNCRSDSIVEVELIKKDATTFPASITPSTRGANGGQWTNVTLVVEDLSTHRRLEEQLLQSQKLDAIGRLSGGVAHDFNNMATIVTGYSDMLLQSYRNDPTLTGWVRQIKEATSKSAELSQQLLAFSRNSVFNPANLDLNLVIDGLRRMIRRLLPDDIALSVVAADDLGTVRADRHRIEQVIFNLVVNARDAMPKGGTLVIETVNAELTQDDVRELPGAPAPGAYAVVSVTDSGIGMEPAILSSIFEPFFTTKPTGFGTGLGLSMVFGTVTQSGGTLSVESEPGQGSTFRVYLPITSAEMTITERAADRVPGIQAGSETILVVEDNEQIVRVIEQVLPTFGYSLLAFRDAFAALEHVRTNPDTRIDLLVTDVVMPSMSGPELAQELHNRLPALRVLFISGYAFNEIERHGGLDFEVNHLQKPFSGIELASKIREVVDRR